MIRNNSSHNQELSQDSVWQMDIKDICPSPENDRIYRSVDPDDPSIKTLAKSIAEHGVKEPIVVTLDNWILSGHRRHVAAKLAGLKVVPVRIDPIRRFDDLDAFVISLREFNRQREKNITEKLREEIISADPEEAYESLIEYRQSQSNVDTPTIQINGKKQRCKISKAKAPMLDAIVKVIAESKKFWPLSDRRIHYLLLNNPPLKHASKPKSVYANDARSYAALTELLTRARLDGSIPMKAIADTTRPVTVWEVSDNTGGFIQNQIEKFLHCYWRDLMQSQPNHIEIICEKNTVEPILKTVAEEFCIPITSGRGFCSLPPRNDMAFRYHRSGKEKLILLIVSDFDPEGEEIAHSFARSMRDDFGIDKIHPVKVALTSDQVAEFDLPVGGTAKVGSTNYKKFVSKYDENVYELESLDPESLQDLLRDAIDEVIDIDTFNAELDAEKRDSVILNSVRAEVHDMLKELDLGEFDGVED